MELSTADLCDKYPDRVRVADPEIFRDYGGRKIFSGKIHTVKCFENNPYVRKALEGPGEGKVLVVDGGGSLRCALLGDMLGEIAVKNKWNGVIVYGCIRDSAALRNLDLGVLAIGTNPMKSSKEDEGQEDLMISFAGIDFNPGEYVYCDGDGILVSETELKL